MYIGGLDVGTTGCKIAVYDDGGRLFNTYYQEYDVVRTGGQHELDFGTVRDGVLALLKSATAECPLAALGVTSFGESFTMLDENDEVLTPAMLYTDPRGEEECRQLAAAFGEERLTLLTGTTPHPMYSISKILWLKSHRPELYARCKRILLGEDFIVYALTGVAQIDYSLAARTAAFDVEKCCWAAEVFEAAGVDMTLMSRPVPAGTVAGVLRPELKAWLGIDYDITVVSGCHDQVAGMIGAGAFSPDTAMDGTGTVECVPVIMTEKPTDISFYRQGYTAVPFAEGVYANYVLSYTGGAMLKWFRDNFAEAERVAAEQRGGNVYADLDAAIKDGPSGLLVLPHFAGAATPYMDMDSRAVIVGLSLETDKLDIYKALMEGASYEMLTNLNAVKPYIQPIRDLRATGGGATSDVWLQIKADILGVPLTALSCKEVGAAGTAALAGVAVGAYADLKDTVHTMVPARRVFTPRPEMTARYAGLYARFVHLYDAVKNL